MHIHRVTKKLIWTVRDAVFAIKNGLLFVCMLIAELFELPNTFAGASRGRWQVTSVAGAFCKASASMIRRFKEPLQNRELKD